MQLVDGDFDRANRYLFFQVHFCDHLSLQTAFSDNFYLPQAMIRVVLLIQTSNKVLKIELAHVYDTVTLNTFVSIRNFLKFFLQSFFL